MGKKSKKKSTGKPQTFPEVINCSISPSGDPIYDVQTPTSINFASTYSKVYVVNSLAKSLIEFFKAVCVGGPLKDTPFENFKVKLHPMQEEKNAEETWETLLYYLAKASLVLEHALPLKLADLPGQLFKEVFISIVQEMEDNEFFSIEGGRADVWDTYTSELGRNLKKHWNKTIPRGAKYWTPEKRAALLKLYNFAIVPIQIWWKKYYSSIKARRRKPTTDERNEAAKNYPSLYPYFNQLSKKRPHQLAIKYVSDVTRIRSQESLRAQISIARKEAKQSKK